MISHEDRIDIVMEVLQRIAPDFYQKYASQAPHNVAEEIKIEPQPRETINPHQSATGLRSLLRKIGPLPPYSVLMGQCSDGLPFLFDLSDPDPGSILILGDEVSGKTQLLLTILNSAAILNRPEQVVIHVITPNSGDFEIISRLPHAESILSTYDKASSELVIELAAIAEQRKSGRERGPVNLLAIDDLASLLSYEEYELSSHLRWLLKYGPRMGVWPIVSLDPRQLNQIDRRLMIEFGTRLIGHSNGYHLPESQQRNVLPSGSFGSFTTVVGSESVNFWVPNLI